LSENIIKPMMHGDRAAVTTGDDGEKKGRGWGALIPGDGERERMDLVLSRIVTAFLAVIALAIAFVFPSRLIFTLVGYVWAGIGSTFSVVILLTLFWKRYSGAAALVTIVTGMVFTIVWIATGMDRVITARLVTFVAALIAAVVTTMFFPSGRGSATKP
ncbi:MAG TPA: hypothetical protein VLA34_03800, partial [Candidatus Krumholzibacterium sp.]|nr:hypothetical protein [Candidatus Krumholzibacterium sp.]